MFTSYYKGGPYASKISQCADVKFDASQYDFFGSNVAEYELEGPNESIKNAPFDEAGNEDYLLSAKQKARNLFVL